MKIKKYLYIGGVYFKNTVTMVTFLQNMHFNHIFNGNKYGNKYEINGNKRKKTLKKDKKHVFFSKIICKNKKTVELLKTTLKLFNRNLINNYILA